MNLKVVMAAKDVDAKALSSATGISTGAIYKYRTGERTPSIKTAQTLADALGCTMDELVGKQ